MKRICVGFSTVKLHLESIKMASLPFTRLPEYTVSTGGKPGWIMFTTAVGMLTSGAVVADLAGGGHSRASGNDSYSN